MWNREAQQQQQQATYHVGGIGFEDFIDDSFFDITGVLIVFLAAVIYQWHYVYLALAAY